MNSLKQVTLCSVTSRDTAVTELALRKSMKGLDFARVVMFSPDPPDSNLIEHVGIPRFATMGDYCKFILSELHKNIDTKFVLITHFDGFVINPRAWDNDFLRYDYIGARWPWHPDNQVGNGGFCLRSSRLLKATSDPRFDRPGIAEDELICRVERSHMESLGLTFAPNELADRFSLEHTELPLTSFGFHGLFHLHQVCNEKEIEELLLLLNPVIFREASVLLWFFSLRNDGHKLQATIARKLLEQQPFKLLVKNCAIFGLPAISVFSTLTEAARM